jgi:hypothetical protein
MHNEREKGNLENWFWCVNQFCDCAYIYDQGSTDNSKEIYDRHPNATVIYSATNNFKNTNHQKNELSSKAELLELLLEHHSDTDWIFWMDGDTITDNQFTRENVEKILFETRHTVIRLGHYNLWRSFLYYRVDSKFHGLHREVAAFWKNTGNLTFRGISGVKGGGAGGGARPKDLPRGQAVGLNLIHCGFATDFQIIKRYKIYKENGYEMKRLLNEKTLEVRRLPEEIIPSWFLDKSKGEIHPKKKTPLFQIYDRENSLKLI